MIATTYLASGSAGIHPTCQEKMIPNQGPRGRFNGKRPFQQQHRVPPRNQSFDSNGPDLKIRGSAYQIFERYVTLSREAATSGDRVAAENFDQHAEHYFRVSRENREGSQREPPRTTPSDVDIDPFGLGGEAEEDRPQPRWEGDAPGFVEPSTS
jgi:hypothetical protein